MVVVLQVSGVAVSTGAEMVTVEVVGAGVGSEVVVVVVVETWCMSATGSAGSEAAVFSMSHFLNEACRSSIAFRMLLGNGPVCDSTQYSCMQSSFALTLVTVSQSLFTIHAGTVAGSVCVVGGMVVAAVGSMIM